MKELHIWLDKIGMCFVGENVYTNYMETERALERDEDVIHTTVTHFAVFALLFLNVLRIEKILISLVCLA